MTQGMDCTGFLQWALPHLGLRWEGYRKVHKQVCKRLVRRMEALGLRGFPAYAMCLQDNQEEWKVLDSLCGITISRFYRDRQVFDALRFRVLPLLAEAVLDAGTREVLCWSSGCASGEEPYTLQIIWRMSVLPTVGREITMRIIATDMNEELLERARQSRYPGSSLKDLPAALREAFVPSGVLYSVKEICKENVEFLKQDIRLHLPEETFHLILCRNLVFTYFDEDLQRECLRGIIEKLIPGGILVIGRRESLPKGVEGIVPVSDAPGIYRKERTEE